MKLFVILFSTLVCYCLAKPLDDSKNAQILKYENDNIGLGGYNYAFETSDGTSRQETAELKDVGGENAALVVRGSYRWVDADGQEYIVTYIADENGFQPTGNHLPSP